MQAFISAILASVLTRVTAWLLARGLEAIHGQELKKTTDIDIDKKLEAFKDAYKNAFNGEPVTAEQRAKLNKSIADFIRNPNPGSL